MPELPEVETIARGLAKRVTGDVIESVWLGQKTDLLKSPPNEIAAALDQSRIAAIRRMGKHIVFDLDHAELAVPSASSGQALRGKLRSPKRKLKQSPAQQIEREGAAPSKAQWIVHLGMT